MPKTSLWERLKGAHVVRVLLVYLGASWVVLQLADPAPADRNAAHLREFLTGLDSAPEDAQAYRTFLSWTEAADALREPARRQARDALERLGG